MVKDKLVSNSICKERTAVILDKITEIKTNDLVHLHKKIDCIDKKLSEFKDMMISKMNYIIIIGIVLALLAGVNIIKVLIDLFRGGVI